MFLKKHVKSLWSHFPVERTLYLKKGIKVITCSCHREEIEIKEKYQIVKKTLTFSLLLNVEHETFVVICQGHPTNISVTRQYGSNFFL